MVKHFTKIGCPKIKSWSSDLLQFTPKNLTISHQWGIHQKQEEGGGGAGRDKKRKAEEERKEREKKDKRGGGLQKALEDW